jgi:hypothetical protein
MTFGIWWESAAPAPTIEPVPVMPRDCNPEDAVWSSALSTSHIRVYARVVGEDMIIGEYLPPRSAPKVTDPWPGPFLHHWDEWRDLLSRIIPRHQFCCPDKCPPCVIRHWEGFGGKFPNERTRIIVQANRWMRRLEWVRRENMRKDVRAAEARSKLLLEEHLSEQQLKTFRSSRYFDVEINEAGRVRRVYRISCDSTSENILRIVPEKRKRRYCIAPRCNVPQHDAWLAQLLWIRYCHDRFLTVAESHYA